MAKGKKTSPEVVYQIMTSWATTDNILETSRQLGMAETTVREIVLANKDKAEYVKLREEKRESFADKAEKVIDLAIQRLTEKLEDTDNPAQIHHLSTVIGTLYDKRALAKGESTENTKITFELPPEVDKYAE